MYCSNCILHDENVMEILCSKCSELSMEQLNAPVIHQICSSNSVKCSINSIKHAPVILSNAPVIPISGL